MLPFRQVGPSITVAGGTPAAATADSSVVLVSNPAAVGTTGYFNYAPTGTIPTGAGVPVLGGQSLQIAVPSNTGDVEWFATTSALIVTPIEIIKC